MRPIIIDISEHQEPRMINYDILAKAVDLVIVRVQYGMAREDRHYQTHLTEFKRRGVPIHVYAWLRGADAAGMQDEAEAFFERAASFEPQFWWLDVEELTMPNMAQGADICRKRLKELGVAKVGVYVANHLFEQLGFNEHELLKYDGVWLPAYGLNNGLFRGALPTATRNYDLHQYTSNGRLPGYSSALDLSRFTYKRPFAEFVTQQSARKYIVQAGDTLSEIGERLGVPWGELAQRNGLTNPDLIYPGTELQY